MLKVGAVRGRILLAAWIALLAGCAEPAEADRAPTPTGPPPTAEPTTTPVPEATPAPFNLSTPAIVIEQSAAQPTATPEGPGIVLPDAPLVVYRPGPGSQVTSPFQVYGRGGPSANERVRVRLLGEDGRVMADQTTVLLAYPGNAGNFVLTLDFDSPWVAEDARLEVSTEDVRFRRMDHLVTIDLVLLTQGSPRVRPALNGPDKLAFVSPRDGGVVEGGVIPVRGGGWTESDQPVTVELLDRGGSPLWSGQVALNAPEPGVLGAFELQIPYDIPWAQYAQLVIYETAIDIPGTRHYSSIELWLRP